MCFNQFAQHEGTVNVGGVVAAAGDGPLYKDTQSNHHHNWWRTCVVQIFSLPLR